MGTLMAIVMIVLLLMGYPLMVPLLAAALMGFLIFNPTLDPMILVQQMIGGIKPASLIAVPLFIFAADIMTRGHTANRLLDLVSVFICHLRGGLPITTAASCTLFGAVSGSTQATVVAMGTPLRPRLLKAGYSDAFTTALIINASDIALLIPPSIGMIVFGVVSGTSVGELFIAGIGPGLMILVLFSVYCYVASRIWDIGTEPRKSRRERVQAAKRALLPMGFPLIVVGGIYAGIVSPTEAAAVSVLYALILELVVYRLLRWKDIPELAVSTGLITAVVFILVGAGAAFSWLLSFAEVPSTLVNEVLALDPSQPTRLLITIAVAF
ncbi:MAG: TRAP transporter large permease, partial [Gammaproteobacteria bacterium]